MASDRLNGRVAGVWRLCQRIVKVRVPPRECRVIPSLFNHLRLALNLSPDCLDGLVNVRSQTAGPLDSVAALLVGSVFIPAEISIQPQAAF